MEQALEDVAEVSPYYYSLNGHWKFNWVKQPSERPVDFYTADFDDTKWKDIPVPSTLESERGRNWFSHKALMNGAVVDFTMSAMPNKQRGIHEEDFPYSFSNEKR